MVKFQWVLLMKQLDKVFSKCIKVFGLVLYHWQQIAQIFSQDLVTPSCNLLKNPWIHGYGDNSLRKIQNAFETENIHFRFFKRSNKRLSNYHE